MPDNLVFAGTPGFALASLRALVRAGMAPVLVLTQPDRPAGRGRKLSQSPVKQYAAEQGIAVSQPEDLRQSPTLAALAALRPVAIVVAAYGLIFPPELLAMPARGCINVHASLLPKYRGAAPVQYAIWCGEDETGITIFQIEPKLDAGPILAVERTPIGPRETSGELEERLAAIAAPLVRRVVAQIAAGTTEPQTQDAARVTKAPRLRKEQGAIDWTKSPLEIDCHIRAMQPWPTAYTFLPAVAGHRARLIVLEVAPLGDPIGEAGTIAEASQRLVVHCGGGAVEVVRLKPEGKREMGAAEFLHGHTLRPGNCLNSQG